VIEEVIASRTASAVAGQRRTVLDRRHGATAQSTLSRTVIQRPGTTHIPTIHSATLRSRL